MLRDPFLATLQRTDLQREPLEDGARDVTEDEHDELERWWGPDDLPAGLCRLDDELCDELLVHGERGLFEVGAHAGADHAGTYDQDLDPVRLEGLTEVQVEAVEAGFGRPVHEVRAPYALPGR